MADWGPSIKTQITVDIQGNDVPKEVKAEIREFVQDLAYGNQTYVEYDGIEDEESWPHTYKFLSSKGIDKCLILYWW